VAIRQKHTTEAVELSTEGKRKALTEGRFKVHQSRPRYNSGYLSDFVAFDEESPKSVDQKAIDKAVAALTKSYTNLTDQLVLGDASEALRLLEQFAKE
jgi:hypothetical protein